jgi:septum formation protein
MSDVRNLMNLILGSQSPRRKEILSYFSLPFTQITSNFDEESVLFQKDPEKYVCDISRGKAALLATRYPQSVILTADTTVIREGKIYGKPSSEEEACQALSELVGGWHTVYTGVTVQQEELVFSAAEGTHVLFNDLTQEQIRQYIVHTNWADKAGGYAIQMAGGLIVRKIEGCYYNVMGLPINTMEKLFKNVDIELWNCL